MMLRIKLEIIKDYHYLGNKYYKLYLSLSSIISCNYLWETCINPSIWPLDLTCYPEKAGIYIKQVTNTLYMKANHSSSCNYHTARLLVTLFYYYYYSIFLKISTISHDVGLDSGSKDIMWAMWGLMRWSVSLCVAGSACIINYFGTLGPPPQSLTTWGPKTLPSKKPP